MRKFREGCTLKYFYHAGRAVDYGAQVADWPLVRGGDHTCTAKKIHCTSRDGEVAQWLERLTASPCMRPGFEPCCSRVGFSEKQHCFSLLNVTRRHINGGLISLRLRPGCTRQYSNTVYLLFNCLQGFSIKLCFTNHLHKGCVKSVAVNQQGLLASGSSDETIQLFDLRRGKELGLLMHHEG